MMTRRRRPYGRVRDVQDRGTGLRRQVKKMPTCAKGPHSHTMRAAAFPPARECKYMSSHVRHLVTMSRLPGCVDDGEIAMMR